MGPRLDRAVRLGVFSPPVPLRVARACAALRRHDVEVVESAVASSVAQFRALLDGTLDAVLTSPDNVIAYRCVPANPLGRTFDVRILLGVDRGLGLSLYAQPAVAAVGQLRGTVVGVDVAESGFAFVLYEILAAAGLRRGADYSVVELGSTPRRLDALLTGGCTATMLNAGPDLYAHARGCRRLRRAVDVCRPYLGTVLAATGEACERDGDRLAALVAALRETGEALVRGEHREAATAEAAASLRLERAAAVRYADRLRDPDEGLLPGGDPDDEALRTVIGLRRRHTAGADRQLAELDAPFPGLVDRRFLPPT
jgi:ABC-type nitrate/sulfonate/bicarbonate transport system substrate-binding protein